MCVQVTATVLCSDGAVAASSVALNAVSAALMCSDIPWEGPLAAVQIAHNASDDDAGQTTIQPTSAQLLDCGLSGIYVGTADTALLADFQVAFLDVCLHMLLGQELQLAHALETPFFLQLTALILACCTIHPHEIYAIHYPAQCN
jgi:polyribonucleotide nucleotidyltransferase